MNRSFSLILKLLTGGTLLAAIFNLSLPEGEKPRSRLYLLDQSPSVGIRGGTDSLRPEDGWKLIRTDARQFDQVTIIGFAQSPGILFQGDPSNLPQTLPEFQTTPGTALAKALESTLLHSPNDVLLLSDGNATGPPTDLEKVLLTLRNRGIAIHTIALGPRTPSDVQISALRAPTRAKPGKEFTLEVDLLSTFDTRITVTLKDHTQKEIDLLRNKPRTISFPGLRISKRTELNVELSSTDDCPENNQAVWIIEPWKEGRRILLLHSTSSGISPLLQSEETLQVIEKTHFVDPFGYDLVLLDSFPAEKLTQNQQKRISQFVTESGGGLLMMGGPHSFSPGGYSGTLIETILPTWASPDEELSLLFLLDRSGSMAAETPGKNRRKLDTAIDAILKVLRSLRPDDRASVVTFSDDRKILSPLTTERSALEKLLRKEEANGPTVLLPTIKEGIRLLSETTSARKAIILLSDGNTEEDISSFQSLGKKLRKEGIKYISIHTGASAGKALTALGPTQPVIEGADLAKQIQKWMLTSQSLILSPTTPSNVLGLPGKINRVTLKNTATLLDSCGEYPLLVIRPTGRGWAGVATFALREGWEGTMRNTRESLLELIHTLAPGPLSPYQLSAQPENDFLKISARGPKEGPLELPIRYRNSSETSERNLLLLKTAASTWTKTIPLPNPGILSFHPIGFRGGSVEVSIPYAAEYSQLGTNLTKLKKISDRTSGKFITKNKDLQIGPSEGKTWKSGRIFFLITALLLFLTDIIRSAFWQPSRISGGKKV
ncbi:MAG: vWA domain-containing protein [Planctomycetota bacterium]|nr:vWA domain-containing protein [Planctomycetota bacterium]